MIMISNGFLGCFAHQNTGMLAT